jgi:shikimate dehydrogenase
MLLHQAVPGFAAWFGQTPTVTPQLRALIETDILAKAPAE